MKLYVYVLQAKDLPATVRDTYVKLRVGKHKSKTRTWKNNNSNTDPVWNEEFVFRVRGKHEEGLSVSVFGHVHDDLGLFSGSGDLVGRVWIPFWEVSAEQNQSFPPTWYSLQKPATGKFVNVDCDIESISFQGNSDEALWSRAFATSLHDLESIPKEPYSLIWHCIYYIFVFAGKILLTLSLCGKNSPSNLQFAHSNVNKEKCEEINGLDMPVNKMFCPRPQSLKVTEGKKLMKSITSRLERVFHKNSDNSRTDSFRSTELGSSSSDYEDSEQPCNCSFEEAIEIMSLRNAEEMPEKLQGGTLVDQTYVVPASRLIMLLFAPDSQFRRDLAEMQGTTDIEEGPWTWKSDAMYCLARTISYTKAATKLVKAVRAIEEQTFIKADGQEFAILATVSTPDAPYGNTFTIELLYTIGPGPRLSSGEESSHLVISWGINFRQSTMMKGMIAGGARQGLKDSFDQLANLLARNCKIWDQVDTPEKDHILANMEAEHQSDWELAYQYFWNFSLLSTIVMVLYVIAHILLCEPSKVQGLEFLGLDLPDSFGQFFICAVLITQLQRAYDMVSHFIQARLQRASDHGIRAQGDGWVLTVALIEGSNLSSLDSTGLSDPYVVLTCNGKTKTSSVQLQTSDPQWNDILEFDAMDEPPSVLDVEVFDFDGPFDQATSLGHAEINFLKYTSTELADMWVSLEGKLAQSSQSKLHLRIFVDNTKGVETIKEYLTKMEKEVGKKLNIRSPHRNSMFQKLFGLPPEEFLISDYTCHLRRKIPLQGKVFLSARIFGFYANLFGHKTKFFFLWEDIEDIQVLPPSLSSVGSPSLVITLRKGKGLEARDWAKSHDEEGRLRFHFQSFVSFSVASRTIMALWRSKIPTAEQKGKFAEDQLLQDQDKKPILLEQLLDQDKRPIMLEDPGCILQVEDAKMSKIYSAELPTGLQTLMEVFGGGTMELKIMEKSGFLDYVTTPWEAVKTGVYERHRSYRFTRHVSIFGGEVTCTQQKSPLENDRGWIINEVMVLHDVPCGDHFCVNMKYLVEKSSLDHGACKLDVYIGVTWLKSTKFQQRITRNVTDKFTQIMTDMFKLAEREILTASRLDSFI
ncbi:hypothetical protein Tsubulata_007102 [Turnera subulata]|uniref:C2 domain-containing protein n=1 Tax=Turnera subulata TaxID=218843 RepID=A0A9Q0GL38_9ROSI|nr:hypothetical protein Tsubulata_007102 [Turnera subulata]